jgi:hypothetical protein
MLRIRRIESYSIARYPEVEFKPWRQPAGATLVRNGALSAALLLMLESCEGGGFVGFGGGTGTTGPPPVYPDFLTENEARTVINKVFVDNGIPLEADILMSIVDSRHNTVNVVLDGYNDSLRVGYEYVTGTDPLTFTPQVIESIKMNTAGSGPYIGIAPAEKHEVDLETLMQAFIDTLKAQGKI